MRVMNYYYACCCLISYYQAMLRFVSVSPILDMLYVITKCYPSAELYCSCGFTNESVSFSFIKAIFSCQNSYNNSHWYTSEIWTLFGRRKHKYHCAISNHFIKTQEGCIILAKYSFIPIICRIIKSFSTHNTSCM